MSNKQDCPSLREPAASPPAACTIPPAPLTERNLCVHEELSEMHLLSDPTIPSWIDSLIAEERIHVFHSQLGFSLSDPDAAPSDDIASEGEQLSQAVYTASTCPPKVESASSANNQLPSSLKLFENKIAMDQKSINRETPLERFLTPGYSDPCFYAKPALANAGIQPGTSEGREKRKQMAKENVELVVSRRVDSP
ncbi:uncharacterized protein BO97DRAFT_452149 [Aspergillus homomorphus CBS 101889]|uniref:Uncharacterized protein n=1 Tax=Aspergillus homomorphus (strain CBS 101889) TaxID=1450537 RepID=A0A395I151_ASPHC|nr:hypothetical protein BO97DRAFT_452149 [Aspergillus homomorphus CBS 101889]RAL12264.1 hypothetical protein BO97DRAFT_452149 [Aspergillus homomorphus CBS 101889]